MIELTYDDIITTGLLIIGWFWVIMTLEKDREEKRNSNPTRISGG
jgi:hypothetical protein